jgi:glutaryl-CoA dehydrogenase
VALRVSPVLDLYGFESLLSADQKAVVDTVRAFVAKEAEPLVRMGYREEKFPEALVPKLAALGVLGGNLSGYGLPGMDATSYGLVMRELERCDSGLRSFASVQGSLVMFPLHAFGSEEQKREWLPKLASAEAIGCFGLTESEGGSDPGAMRTTAEDKGDHWLLKGSKMWITNGNLAKVAIVWAKTANGIRGFVVPTDTPGFRAVAMRGKLSLRASNTSELYFENVKLPKEALLPKSEGLKSALQCLNQARYGIAFGVLGAAEACFAEALGFVSNRKVFGKSLAGFQLVQRKLALMASKITQGQLLAWRLGQLKDRGELHHAHVSLAKQANVEMALETARVARDLLGANGIMDEYKTMRHLCNLETVYTYEGTNDIHLLIVAKELTGLAAFEG